MQTPAKSLLFWPFSMIALAFALASPPVIAEEGDRDGSLFKAPTQGDSTQAYSERKGSYRSGDMLEIEQVNKVVEGDMKLPRSGGRFQAFAVISGLASLLS